jgi:hypothetical protein
MAAGTAQLDVCITIAQTTIIQDETIGAGD